MRIPLVPVNFVIPIDYIFDGYKLELISTKNVEEDLQALISNAETIVQLRGGGSRDGWPFVCTLEENLKDLAWLELCAKYRQLFSYIMRNNTNNKYTGCIYIYPIELFYPELAHEFDVDFSFWITKDEYEKGNYKKIFVELINWLTTDWSFVRERIYLRNKELPNSLK